MSEDIIKKAPNDVLKITMTCTMSKYTINTVNRKKDNVSIRVCNVSGYIVTSNGFQNVKIVIYNERYIKLFEKFSQEGTKFLIIGNLSIRTYEKDGVKHTIYEIIIGDSGEMHFMKAKKRLNEDGTVKTYGDYDKTTDNSNTNNNYNNNNNVVDKDLEEFDFDVFLNEDKE